MFLRKFINWLSKHRLIAGGLLVVLVIGVSLVVGIGVLGLQSLTDDSKLNSSDQIQSNPVKFLTSLPEKLVGIGSNPKEDSNNESDAISPSNDNPRVDDSNSKSDTDNTQELQKDVRLSITLPQSFNVIAPQDSLLVRIDKPILETAIVVLKESDFFCNNDSSCESNFSVVQKVYKLGEQDLRRVEFSRDIRSIPSGQYIVQLVLNNTIIGESSVFAITNSREQLSPVVPFDTQKISRSTLTLFRWGSSSDIFYLNLYLENADRRWTLATGLINSNFFSWTYIDETGNVIPNGDYVLVFENQVTKQTLSRIRFTLQE